MTRFPIGLFLLNALGPLVGFAFLLIPSLVVSVLPGVEEPAILVAVATFTWGVVFLIVTIVSYPRFARNSSLLGGVSRLLLVGIFGCFAISLPVALVLARNLSAGLAYTAAFASVALFLLILGLLLHPLTRASGR